MTFTDQYGDLPGAALVAEGLRDAASGVESVGALLIAIGAPRLRRLGLSVPDTLPADGELRLYRRLRDAQKSDAYAEYNALIRELVSFERALEHRHERARAEQK